VLFVVFFILSQRQKKVTFQTTRFAYKLYSGDGKPRIHECPAKNIYELRLCLHVQHHFQNGCFFVGTNGNYKPIIYPNMGRFDVPDSSYMHSLRWNEYVKDTQLSTQKRGRSKEKEINRTDHRCMRGEQKPKPYNQLNVHVFWSLTIWLLCQYSVYISCHSCLKIRH
jgi:hypothetical protein